MKPAAERRRSHESLLIEAIKGNPVMKLIQFPDQRSAHWLVGEALVTAITTLVVWGGDFSSTFTASVGLILCGISFSHCLRFAYNLSFIVRTAALGIPGAMGCAMLMINSNAAISYWAFEYQTLEIAKIGVLVTAMGLAGNSLAWGVTWWGPLRPQSPRNAGSNWPPLAIWVPLFLIVCAAFSFLELQTARSLLITASPGVLSEGGAAIGGINVYNIGVIGTLLGLLVLGEFHPGATRELRVLMWTIAIGDILYLYVLRGARAEGQGFLIAVLVLLVIKRGHMLKFRTLMLIGFSLSAAATAMAVARGAVDGGLNIEEALQTGFDLLKADDFGLAMPISRLAAFPGLLIVHLLYATIGAMGVHRIELQWGGTVFNLLINTLPESINPWRIEDLAYMLFNQGFVKTGGGFMELAEAYFNFGMFGALPICFIVSLIYYRLARRAALTPQFGPLIWAALSSFLLVRATHYGVSFLYKGLLTWWLVFGTLKFFANDIQKIIRKTKLGKTGTS